MKKKVLAIYVAMIIIGIVGLFLVLQKPQPQVVMVPAATKAEAKPVKETITVAVATKNLPAKTILAADDFQMKTMEVMPGSQEKQQFSLRRSSLTGYATTTAIAEGAYLPEQVLIEPGSDAYIGLFLQPGNVLYTFPVANKSYLLRNVAAGKGIDIYLSYSQKPLSGGGEAIVSPAAAIESTRLKPLMKNRRILKVALLDDESLLMVELTAKDVKLLEAVEGKAKVLLFPAATIEQSNTNNSALRATEASWPVSDDAIFDIDSVPVNELRPSQ